MCLSFHVGCFTIFCQGVVFPRGGFFTISFYLVFTCPTRSQRTHRIVWHRPFSHLYRCCTSRTMLALLVVLTGLILARLCILLLSSLLAELPINDFPFWIIMVLIFSLFLQRKSNEEVRSRLVVPTCNSNFRS